MDQQHSSIDNRRTRPGTARTAIVLAGHGSLISPETGDLVWRQVDRLRVLHIADEVTAAFWKAPPAYAQVIDTLRAAEVVVVPLFTANGYFTRTVIPAEMGLSGSITRRADRVIRYTLPIGSRIGVGEIIDRTIAGALARADAPADQIAIAILGHATRRDPRSRLATEAMADRVRSRGLAREVIALYLDDTPDIAELFDRTSAPVIIAVPYFLALGSHAGIDVPHRIGLEVGQTEAYLHDRTVYYTPVLGAEDNALTALIIDLIREAGLPLPTQHADQADTKAIDRTWIGFPQMGADRLTAAFAMGLPNGLCQFGQIALIGGADGGEARHIDDRDRPANQLAVKRSPAELRNAVRINAEGGDDGAYGFRPLPTQRDLPHGWRASFSDSAQLPAIIETIYPGAVADWAAAQDGTLQARTFDQVIARQVGAFRALRNLTAPQTDQVIDQVCGGCVRVPTWHDGRSGAIPCAEPCNRWLTQALQLIMPEPEKEGQ